MHLVKADIDRKRSGRIALAGAFYEVDALKAVPGVKFHGRGEDYWSIPLTLPAFYALANTFEDERLELSDALYNWTVETYESLVEPMRMLKAGLIALPAGFSSPSLAACEETWEKQGLKLRNFQRVAALALPLAEQLLLADDLGSGKTIEVVAALSVLEDMDANYGDTEANFSPLPALIVVPKSVLYMWPEVLAAWAPWFERVTVLDGTPAKRRKAIEAFKADDGQILITTLDILKAHSRADSYGNHSLKRCEACGGSPGEVTEARCEAHAKELNDIAWRTVILDEAHRIQDPTTTQTRTVWGVSKGAHYRWALTGTPIEASPAQLWPILHFLDPHEWPSSVAYRDRYIDQYQNHWGGIEVKGLLPHRTAEFHLATEHRTLRRSKEMVLPELPPKVYVERHIELSAKERKVYNAMHDHLITSLDSGTLWADGPLTLASRLFQMSSGLIDVKREDDEAEVTFLDHSAVLDEVDALVAEMTPLPLVIYFVNVGLLKHCLARLLKKGHFVSVLYGDVSPADRAKAITDFQEGRNEIFLASYGAGSEGITLTRSSTMIRAQRPWSSLQDKQAEDRLHRIGAEVHESITYVDIIPQDTLAAKVPLLLANKQANIQEVLRDAEMLRRLLDA